MGFRPVILDNCLDYRKRDDLKEEDEELWALIGYTWYGDELIPIRPQRLTNEERLQILDTHPFFTGVCPECGYQLLRQGGLMVIDNTLWGGQVADSTVQDQDTAAIRALNEKIYQDSRFNLSLLPMADGITLVRKQ